MKKSSVFIFIICIVLVLSSVLIFQGCSNSKSSYVADWQKKYTAGSFGITSSKNPLCEIYLSTGQSIRLELYKDIAPESVSNFIELANDGFYNGILFHRIIAGFVIQAGGFELQQNAIIQKESPNGTIKGEFVANGVKNSLQHTAGVISMARASDYNSGSSQFFICAGDCRDSLDGNYAGFGKVIDEESMEVVLDLGRTPTTDSYLFYGSIPVPSQDVPTKIISIEKIVVYK